MREGPRKKRIEKNRTSNNRSKEIPVGRAWIGSQKGRDSHGDQSGGPQCQADRR
jgi:hypothetical protein